MGIFDWLFGGWKSRTKKNIKTDDGENIIYYENGEVKELFTKIRGKIEGSYKSFYRCGDKYEEFNYVNGKKNGLYKQYTVDYKNSRIVEGNYKDDKKHGLFKIYSHGIGQYLMEECTWDNGKEDENITLYYSDGTVKYQGNNKNRPVTESKKHINISLEKNVHVNTSPYGDLHENELLSWDDWKNSRKD